MYGERLNIETMNVDQQAIRDVVEQFETGLNASSISAVLPLYAPEGVFMPPGSLASAGTNALRIAYNALFAASSLQIKFTIVEVHQVSADWGFARTNSAEVNTAHANGASAPQANHALFIFQRIAGDWKIARYCFCAMKPAGE